MNTQKAFSIRSFVIVTLFPGVMCLLAITALHWGLSMISEKIVIATANHDIPDIKSFIAWYANFQGNLLGYGIPLIIAVFFIWSLFIWLFLRRKPLQQEMVLPREEPSVTFEDGHTRGQMDSRLFLHLLSMLQKEGRFLDFLSENLENYEDDQIGAAVRSIHENCKKVTEKYISLKPVLEASEGETITIEKGFDSASIKLVGNITGEPPFTGIIRHKGWKAEKLELPVLSKNQDKSMIAPAEVEI